ncbi:MAG: PAS domain S-box protein, partial [Campylobacterales bacterium]|nr:PAS domain S-box protein [Campylobacterales bacterium]
MMSEQKIQTLEKALLREKLARKEAEKILEERALELYQTNQRLSRVLNEKEIQLENLFKTIVDPYILMDLNGNVLKMNDAAIDFYGYNIEKEPFNVVRTLYKDDVEYAMSSFGDLLEKGNFRNFQARVYIKSKALKWVHINSSIVYDNMGKPLFAQGILRDITKEREQQQIFDEQKKQLKTIVDHSSLGIVLTQYGKILKTNKAFQDFLGYTEEELLQKEVKDLSIKEDYTESRDYMEQLMSGKINEFSIEKKYLTKDQSLVWAKTSVSMVKDLNNKVKYQVAVVEDITEELKNKSLL